VLDLGDLNPRNLQVKPVDDVDDDNEDVSTDDEATSDDDGPVLDLGDLNPKRQLLSTTTPPYVPFETDDTVDDTITLPLKHYRNDGMNRERRNLRSKIPTIKHDITDVLYA
jgi:hypothetical protein